MVVSENDYGSSQLPKSKLPLSDSDDEFSDLSYGSSDNYIPDQAEDSNSSEVRN
jgi:hypothetical protein